MYRTIKYCDFYVTNCAIYVPFDTIKDLKSKDKQISISLNFD